MSDIFIPELMELDSYWQKAVEDAIRDTVKGEEKLQNALRNRKKINEKLANFGLKSTLSRMRISKLARTGVESPDEQTDSKTDTESDSEGSAVTVEEGSEHFESCESRSKSVDTPYDDDEQRSPTRPLFGNGSLEKIKRSQNSFNYEPMGEEGMTDEQSEIEKEEEEELTTDSGMNSQRRRNENRKEKNKNIQWLHVRDDRNFERSDSESTWGGDEHVDTVQFMRHPFGKNKNYFLDETPGYRLKSGTKMSRLSRKLQPDLLSQKEANNALKDRESLKRRLELALAKREILNKKQKLSSCARSKSLIEVSQSAAKLAEKQPKGKKLLSSFIKFYLEVYRDLYHKMPVKRIAEEASRRWRAMTTKERAKWADGTKTAEF